MTDADDPTESIDRLLAAVGTRPDTPAPAGSLHVHCTDADGEWYVEGDPAGAAVVTREHRKGDAVLRGPAGALLVTLRSGSFADGVEVLGDETVAGAWSTATAAAAAVD